MNEIKMIMDLWRHEDDIDKKYLIFIYLSTLTLESLFYKSRSVNCRQPRNKNDVLDKILPAKEIRDNDCIESYILYWP